MIERRFETWQQNSNHFDTFLATVGMKRREQNHATSRADADPNMKQQNSLIFDNIVRVAKNCKCSFKSKETLHSILIINVFFFTAGLTAPYREFFEKKQTKLPIGIPYREFKNP